ncbi:hypothetical protein Naga_100190g13, partial [Nannochloropsis gaditana]
VQRGGDDLSSLHDPVHVPPLCHSTVSSLPPTLPPFSPAFNAARPRLPPLTLPPFFSPLHSSLPPPARVPHHLSHTCFPPSRSITDGQRSSNTRASPGRWQAFGVSLSQFSPLDLETSFLHPSVSMSQTLPLPPSPCPTLRTTPSPSSLCRRPLFLSPQHAPWGSHTSSSLPPFPRTVCPLGVRDVLPSSSSSSSSSQTRQHLSSSHQHTLQEQPLSHQPPQVQQPSHIQPH